MGPNSRLRNQAKQSACPLGRVELGPEFLLEAATF